MKTRSIQLIHTYSYRSDPTVTAKQLKQQAAAAFNALTKELQSAKFDEIRSCLKSGAYMTKVNDAANRSSAYDYLDLIVDKQGIELECFFYCETCSKASRNAIIFADTSNGTSKLLSHVKRFHKETGGNDATIANDAPSGSGIKQTHAQNTAANPSLANSYTFDAKELSDAFSKMTRIGNLHGELQSDVISSLLPKPHEW